MPSATSKLGFIGYGSMARMLIQGFLASKTCAPKDIVVSTRTRENLPPLAAAHPGLIAAQDNRQTALLATHLFLCVKPLELKGVLEGIRGAVRKDAHLISIAACASLEYLNRIAPGKYTRVIPSLASAGGHGMTLVCHGPGVSAAEAALAEKWFAALGPVMRLPEKDFEAGSGTKRLPHLALCIFVRLRSIHQSGIAANDVVPGVARHAFEGRVAVDDGPDFALRLYDRNGAVDRRKSPLA